MMNGPLKIYVKIHRSSYISSAKRSWSIEEKWQKEHGRAQNIIHTKFFFLHFINYSYMHVGKYLCNSHFIPRYPNSSYKQCYKNL